MRPGAVQDSWRTCSTCHPPQGVLRFRFGDRIPDDASTQRSRHRKSAHLTCRFDAPAGTHPATIGQRSVNCCAPVGRRAYRSGAAQHARSARDRLRAGVFTSMSARVVADERPRGRPSTERSRAATKLSGGPRGASSDHFGVGSMPSTPAARRNAESQLSFSSWDAPGPRRAGCRTRPRDSDR